MQQSVRINRRKKLGRKKKPGRKREPKKRGRKKKPGRKKKVKKYNLRNIEKDGSILAKRRKELGMTIAQVAKKVHTSTTLVYKYEVGERNPEEWRVPLIAEALEMDIYEVFNHFLKYGSPRIGIKKKKKKVEKIKKRQIGFKHSRKLSKFCEWRVRKNLSLKQLQELIGTDFAMISNWENGKHYLRKIEKIILIADVFGVKPIEVKAYFDDVKRNLEKQKEEQERQENLMKSKNKKLISM